MENKNLHIVKLVWVNACRFLLGIVFVFSGFVKAVDPLGFTYKIEDYLQAFGILSWIPDGLPLVAAIGLAGLEFFLGILMFCGIRRKISTTLTLAFMAFMTPLTLYLAIANPVSDCGCFGDALVLTNWETFFKNIVLLIAAVSTYIWKYSIIRFFTVKTQWLISLYSIIFIIMISAYCLVRLPILDFRPYKIGNNILDEMTIPEGAEQSIYETVFILEKDGKKQEFTLDNYPDSTWTFKEAKTILRKQGYEPAIQDFSLLSLETGEDITKDILTDNNYNFLLVAHRIEKADDSDIDLINEIYDYSLERGYGFYGLTSSPDIEIEQWRDRTGAEYPFCLVDDITLKTIIRSNPGLILIHNGTILNKWPHGNLPDEYSLTDSLENLPLGQLQKDNDIQTILIVVLWFAIPLMLVLALDLLVIKRREKKRLLKAQNS